jgi:hypothetical protein
VLDLTYSAQEEDLASAGAESVTAELIATHRYTVVERRKIAHVIREQALGQTGIVSETTAIKVGAILGAKFLVIGRLSRIGDLFRLDARMLDSETARVAAAAHADFRDRVNLDLAAREMVRGLVAVPKPPASVGAGTVAAAASSAATIEPIVDPSHVKDAAADIAQQVGKKFAPFRARLDGVDDVGQATAHTGGQFAFRGLHLAIYGTDSMTGTRALKGYMLVQTADQNIVSGRTTATTEPCAAGDEAVALPFVARVKGPSPDAAKALQRAINGLPQFSATESDATPLDVYFDLKGQVVGDRRLSARILDAAGNLLATVDSAVSL